MWLADTALGELAGPLHRDLIRDRLDFDDLGFNGLRDYILYAPPGTAIHHHRSDGWQTGDHLTAELVSDLRELLWRYTAVHFKNGAKAPFPQRITHPGEPEPDDGPTWETVEFDDIVTPEVLALLADGGGDPNA